MGQTVNINPNSAPRPHSRRRFISFNTQTTLLPTWRKPSYTYTATTHLFHYFRQYVCTYTLLHTTYFPHIIMDNQYKFAKHIPISHFR